MNGLLQELLGLAEVEHIRRELESGCPSAVMTGLSPVHRVLLSAAVSLKIQRLCWQNSGRFESTGCRKPRLVDDGKTIWMAMGRFVLVLLS